MKKLFLLVLLAPALFLHAQKFESTDTSFFAKKEYRYVGIQMNLLLQQFISFNSNSSINNNPYLFSYAKNDALTGKGFVFGTGFQINEASSDDGVSSNDSRNVNISVRVGFERKYFQKQRFIPFWGIDFGAGVLYSRVSSTLHQVGNTTTVVETDKIFAGPAFRAGLLFAITKRVLLGTEFFFNAQIAATSVNGSSFTVSDSFVPFNIGFQAPTALFLTYRF